MLPKWAINWKLYVRNGTYSITFTTYCILHQFKKKIRLSISLVRIETVKHLKCAQKMSLSSPLKRKIVVMGYRSVGKTSICAQFAHAQFYDHGPTIENNFRKVVRTETCVYELNLVDTAGQDEFSTLFPSQYVLDAHAYVLIYGLDNMRSFEAVIEIFEKLKDITGGKNFRSVLVGNKFDILKEREVPQSEGERLAEVWNTSFLETSAKYNFGVLKIFEMLVNEMERVDLLGMGNKNRHNSKSTCIVF